MSAAETVFQEACNALDKLPSEKSPSKQSPGGRGGGTQTNEEVERARLKAEISYGLAECLAFRGAAKMAGRIFTMAARAAARGGGGEGGGGGGGGGGAGDEGVKGTDARIWGGDMRQIRFEALDRAVRCLMAVQSMDEALTVAKELTDAGRNPVIYMCVYACIYMYTYIYA